ncbi:MAG TPA: fumarylacetoacetate hydrolase, partial [Caulobacter sp.]|nr:fumarylacetoacetate hydrolase [Caulobacter sp.]
MALSDFLPDDWRDATLLGRIDFGQGPTPVLIRGGRIEDVSRIAPTTSDLMNAFAPGAVIPRGDDLGPLEALDVRAVWENPEGAAAKLLA